VVAGTMRVSVYSDMCQAARAGDTVIVVIGPGYFGRPWIQAARVSKLDLQSRLLGGAR
jgi:hypothetical protein